jgi:ornithine cyclodeaminase/alanine dehydrogenase-like protein (mu-crystallin family)
MPIEDIAWATRVLDRATEQDIGVELPLWETPAMS